MYLFFAFLTGGLFIVDMMIYPGFVKKYSALEPTSLFLFFTLISIFIFSFSKKNLSLPVLSWNTFFLFPCTFLVSLILTGTNVLTYANFVYNTFHVYFPYLLFISLISGQVVLLSIDKKILKKHMPIFIFLISIILILAGVSMRFWPQDIFFQLSKEDQLFENLQVLFYAMATILAVKSAYIFLAKKQLFFAFLFFLLSLGLFAITGEEISWGQRFFHLVSPEIMVQYNTQKEITVHNLNGINQYQYLFYIIISFTAAASWLLYRKLSKKSFLKILIPQWYFMGFFLPIFIFYVYMNFLQGVHWEWQEFAELIFSIGIFFFLFQTLSLLREK